jgi:hypothetical protein
MGNFRMELNSITVVQPDAAIATDDVLAIISKSDGTVAIVSRATSIPGID